MPTRISTWLFIIAVISGLFAVIRWQPIMVAPLALIGFFVGPYFIRRIARSFFELMLGVAQPWNPTLSTGVAVVGYGLIALLIRAARLTPWHREEWPFLMLLSVGLAAYGGFIACLTMQNREKTWERLRQHPMIWQAVLHGLLFATALTHAVVEQSTEALIISWFALAFGIPFVHIARQELADRRLYGTPTVREQQAARQKPYDR